MIYILEKKKDKGVKMILVKKNSFIEREREREREK
jgi:hypothetical protein